MKKLILTGLIFALSVIMAFASSTVHGPQKIQGGGYRMWIDWEADGSTFADTSITQDNANALITLEGYWLSDIKVVPGTTGPTENSDLTITNGGTDILGGNGSNIVDNTGSGFCKPYGSNGDAQYQITGPEDALIFNIDNNAVSGASVTIYIGFDKP